MKMERAWLFLLTLANLSKWTLSSGCWHLNNENRYITPEYYGNGIDHLLDYNQYGNCIYRNNLDWSYDFIHTYAIVYQHDKH